MRFHLVALLLACTFAFGCHRPPCRADRFEKVDRAAHERLDRPISMPAGSLPLESAIDGMRQKTGVNMFVNWWNLESIGVEKKTVVTLPAIENAPGSAALDALLRQVGTDPTNPVTHAVRGGVVWIDTHQFSLEHTQTRVYDVRDLIAPGPRRSEAHPTRDPLEEEIDHRDELMRLIESMIGHPETWEAGGGTSGRIRAFKGNLVIEATPEQHEEIEVLLCELRRSLARARPDTR